MLSQHLRSSLLRPALSLVGVVCLAGMAGAQDEPDPFEIIGDLEPEVTEETEAAPEDSGDRYIVGKVYDRSTGQGVPLAPISLFKLSSPADSLGEPWGGIWADDVGRTAGEFQLFVSPGHWKIQVNYFGYDAFVKAPINTTRLDTVYVDIPLGEDLQELDFVEVQGIKRQDTEQSVITERREAAAIVEGISKEQISKGTDSNAADVAARMTGLSVLDGGLVYVRGLGERYSSTQVNGVTVASPEPNKRVVPLDQFAAGLIDKISVQKSWTPDKPAAFAGGLVDVKLRDFPGNRVLDLGVSIGHASQTTGLDFMTYDGGTRDWLGFDDGTRELPKLINEIAGNKIIRPSNLTDEEQEAIGEAFTRVWTADRTSGNPNFGVSAAYGDKADLGGVRIGFISTGSLSDGFQTRQQVERTLNSSQAGLFFKNDYDVDQSQQSVLWGVQNNLNFAVGRKTTLSFRTSYNRSAEDKHVFYQGWNNDIGDTLRVDTFEFVERGTFLGTLELNHPLPFGAKMTWRGSRSNAERNEPDRRSYSYIKRDNPILGPHWRLFELDPNFTRRFGETDDDEQTTEVHLEIPIRGWTDAPIKIKTGYLDRDKERSTVYRRFRYRLPNWRGYDQARFLLPPDSLMTEEYIGWSSSDPDEQYFHIFEQTQPTDGFEGTFRNYASYAMSEVPITRRLSLVGGVRWENSRMAVDAKNPYSEDEVTADDNRARLTSDAPYPMGSFRYLVGERTTFRGAAYRTTSRPDLRELAPMGFPEFRSSATIIGNKNLKNTRIENYEVRLETFPGPTELLAISGFYKEFERPVVYTVSAGTSTPDKMPVNANGGEIYGLELEARFAMRRVASWLRDFNLSFNWAVTESSLDTEGIGGIGSSRERPMEGQSPYVVNLSLYIDTPGTTSMSILYNIFGERLRDVSTAETLPDIYEQPRHSFDLKFILNERIKMSFENIFDDAVEYQQGDEIVRSWRNGRKVSISYTLL